MSTERLLLTYFPQVEEAIWSEFPGPFQDMNGLALHDDGTQ